jgi:protein gp37
LQWKSPRKIFVDSMGDLFHGSAPDEWIDKAFAVMALCPQHTFQVLTKRSKRMQEYCSGERRKTLANAKIIIADMAADAGIFKARDALIESGVQVHKREIGALAETEIWPLPNVWLGVSAEDQTRADERIPDLLATPAAVRFVSAEPLLGPIDFESVLKRLRRLRLHPVKPDKTIDTSFVLNSRIQLDWIISGGESGHGARPMHPEWVRSIRDQCQASGTAFFFKQWGEWAWAADDHNFASAANHAKLVFGEKVKLEHHSSGHTAAKVGKAKASNILDGKTHNQFPEVK